ncbi:uncharacterized protein LOC111337905 [Stylophora pistillata]|uniref:uncharacterized protein LOC111337905 n=1 Tax=Stylophora pistillata TaxID=50429 RepID=UPI000C04CDB1|nr:uncharacterized protein LOC111337905 [Stylophora pistillata]
MAGFSIIFKILYLLSQIFESFQATTSNILTYKCDSSNLTLRYAAETLAENPCSGCRINETKLPICQRRLYAPIASCKDKSTRISFSLKVWPTGEIPDSEANNQPAESLEDSHDILTMQPQGRAIVLKLSGVSLVQYSGLSFNWSSNSSSLNFTMDYSMDGFHWIDYTEDERVKVFQVYRYHPTVCLCRKVMARYLRIKITETSEFAPWMSGYLDATFCSITAGGWSLFNSLAAFSHHYTNLCDLRLP